jgi:hypothetical protein
MTRGHTWLTAGLGVLLAASNLWWFYQALDQASIGKYQQFELDYRSRALDAALRAIPSLTAELGREQVISRVTAAIHEPSPFDKDGVTVIAPLTFRFDTTGRVVQVGTIYDPRP